VLEQEIQQPAGEMHREFELGIAMQRFDEGPIAAAMRIVHYFVEIPHWLVGMHA